MLTRFCGICCFLLAVLYTAFIHGHKSICTVDAKEACLRKIDWIITKVAAKEGLSFNLYRNTGEKAERIAVLNFVGFYLCHSFKGYECQTICNRTFSLTSISCEPNVEFTFSADGEQPERCENTTRRGKREADDDGCDEDTLSETADKQHSESNTDNNKEGKLDREEDTQTQGVTSLVTGLSIGGLLITVVIVSLVFFLLRRNLLKRKNDAELQKSTENTDDPLLLTTGNGEKIRPEDKERSLFILNIKTSDYI